MELHGRVGCIAHQTVSAVITHRDFIRQFFCDIHFVHLIHLRRGLIDQQAKHFCFGLKLDQRKLNALIGRERLAKGGPLFCIGEGLI